MVNRGDSYERELYDLLRGHGFLAYRVAGSGKGAIDIIAISSTNETYLFEVKSCRKDVFYPSSSPEQLKEMRMIHDEYIFDTYYAVRWVDRKHKKPEERWEFYFPLVDAKVVCKKGGGLRFAELFGSLEEPALQEE